MKKLSTFSFLTVVIFINAYAQSIPQISGWSFTTHSSFTFLSPPAEGVKEKTFVYRIGNTGKSTQTPATWFAGAVATDMAAEQWHEPHKGASQPAGIALLYVTEVSDSNQQKWYLCYIGYQLDNKLNRFARIKSTADAEFFKTYTTIATKHFARLAGEDQKLAVNTTKSPEAPPAVVAPPQKAMPPYVTGPGKGVQSAAIHQTIMHLEYEVGMGGGIFPVYNAYVLFKNGSAYKYPFYSMEDLDEKASRIAEPKKWGTWKMQNDKLVLNWPVETPRNQNETWGKDTYYNVVAAKRGEGIEGNFKSISGGGNTALGGDVMVFAADNLVMNPDGRFTTARVAGVNSSRDFWETNSSKSSEAGIYKLNGHTIEFQFNNGKTERRFFFFYPDSKKHFGIGYSVYMPKK